MRIALCQDCLKVKPYSTKRHLGEELCECGGEFCGCSGCVDTAKKLRRGKRKAWELGTRVDIEKWCPETGIR